MIRTKEILEAHGERLKVAMEDALGKGEKTKFIITAGDERVCPACTKAEMDGSIPVGQPYSNGLMGPSFHGKTCRCTQVTSDELAASLQVRATEERVDVGIFEPQAAHAASIREYGSGNGPPNPAIRIAMANIKEEVFNPFYDDLSGHFKKIFLK
ncbi:MAG: hypothetical protein WCW68_01545 [Methanothrix sp.]